MEKWKFYPSCDINGHDIVSYPGKSVEELIKLAEQISDCVAFNTNGWMKNVDKGITEIQDFKHGGLFVNIQKQKEVEFLKQKLIENYNNFKEWFSIKNIEGVVKQKIGGKSNLTLGRDDSVLKYDQIIVINNNKLLSLEEDLCKIFYNNFILSTVVGEYDSNMYPNLIIGQKDHELINRIIEKSSLIARKISVKPCLVIINCDVNQSDHERRILKELIDKTRNISQMIITIHNLCIGNMEEIGGLFSMLEYLSLQFIVIDFQESDMVTFENVTYPNTIQITYINNLLYNEKQVNDSSEIIIE